MLAKIATPLCLRGLASVRCFSNTSGRLTATAYQYTIDDNEGKLSAELRDQYEKNGFFVVRKLVPDDKLDKFKARFQKICAEKIRVPVMTVMRDVTIAKSEFVEGEKAITKIQDFCQDDLLFEFCRAPEIVQYIQGICGKNLMAMHTMLINKPPGM